jgi:hypothetical protein
LQHKEYVLSIFSKDKAESLRRYRRFVSMADDEELSKVYEKKKWPSVLGPEGFVDSMKDKSFSDK